jgi:acyl-CoA synthetase (AMP-forming)/AMP-acid ligase II
MPFEMGLKFFEYFNPPAKTTIVSLEKDIGLSLLVCFYGATETTSEVTWELFDDQEDFREKANNERPSIGLPLQNNTVYILDEDFNVVPQGSVGEV